MSGRRPFRILMLTDRFPPEVRSSAHLFHDLARELKRRGHEVAVITRTPVRYLANGHRARLGWEEVAGVPALRVRGFPLAGLHPAARALEHLALGWTFGRAAHRWPGADVVLVYSPPLPLAFAARTYERRFGAPLILNVQDLYPQTAIDLGLLRNRLGIRLAEDLERRAYQAAARIVVHSEGNRAVLTGAKGVPADRVRVIYNWVDVEAVRPGVRDDGFRREHGLGGTFVVSYAGLMGYAQDLRAVLECAALMRDADVLFLLVGEGVLEGRWKALAAERQLTNVRFLPMQPKDRYVSLLAASDVCLVPLDGALRTPVVPGKLQSIMAAGRPAVAIAAEGGDTPRLVQQSGAGVHVPPGDPGRLAGVLRQLMADRGLRLEMGRRGRAFAEAHFSTTRCADAYEALFAEVAGERPRRRG